MVAAWMTHLDGSSPAAVATASPRSIGASSSLSSWMTRPPGAHDRPGDAAAVPQLGVGGVGDRVDLELCDVGLADLDPRHGRETSGPGDERSTGARAGHRGVRSA